jgi:hypothetical protein
MKNSKKFTIKTENGISFPLVYGTVDNKRLINCFKHIAYGLYFIDYNKIFEGECRIIPGFLDYPNDDNLETLKKLLKKKEKTDSINWEKKGDNPQVFYYQFSPPDKFGLLTLIMTFYEGVKVFVAFKEKSIQMPFDLTEELINAGLKVTYQFPDGDEFEFNKDK